MLYNRLFGSTRRNTSFVSGESPSSRAASIRIKRTISPTSTPEGHASTQRRHRMHDFSDRKYLSEYSSFPPTSASASVILPRATINSSFVSANTGHTDRHVPHFEHLSISISN
jgi:type IV secretory pathway ATPase VirB11/archaellum biosynthesis ATPase